MARWEIEDEGSGEYVVRRNNRLVWNMNGSEESIMARLYRTQQLTLGDSVILIYKDGHRRKVRLNHRRL